MHISFCASNNGCSHTINPTSHSTDWLTAHVAVMLTCSSAVSTAGVAAAREVLHQ